MRNTYLFTYRYRGADWSFQITAEGEREAKERLAALSLARFDGVLVAQVPAPLGIPARAICAIRNFFAKGESE